MLTKNDFSSTEWNTLRDCQFLVGIATLMAGSSGLGTIKESIAVAQGVIENQDSPFAYIRDLTGTAEIEAAQSGVKQRLGGPLAKPTKENLQKLAIDQVRESISILNSKATPEESDAYRKLIYGVAERVANAASEGGFLGFGGTRVSSEEVAFMDQLRNTLQMERVKKA